MTHQVNPASSVNDARQINPVATAPVETKARQDGLEHTADRPGATLPPYRPAIRRALRYDLAMRIAAARAAAAQPRLVSATSNVITWKELRP